jgi:aerobic-type carbon monoxide dehydrogenase small subunit (CoxS/CutS family)
VVEKVKTPTAIGLTVNGQHYTFLVQPNWTLQYLLHDQLGLVGVKEFCDRGACGACNVILDGSVVLSCMTLAIQCDGASVETVEGIAASGHPLIEAYVKYSCMQCGFCTPGFVVAAKSFLDHNLEPTESQVMQALAGNLCRCGTYPQHIKAVLEAAAVLRETGRR